jgi:lysophospholipase L1-like esterase
VDKRWLLGGILIGTGIGLVALAKRRPKISEGARVLLFGDSLAMGLNPQLKQLAEEAGVAAYTGKGVVGSRIDQWSQDRWLDGWLDATLDSFQPTIILVSLGTNDEATYPGAVGREEGDFHALLGKLRATGAEIVWIGPPELPFPRQGISDMIRENVPYYFESEQLDIPRAPDHLHPNAVGYAGWAGAIWRWLT